MFTAAKHSAQRAVYLLCAVVWVVLSCPLIVVPWCLESDDVELGICRPIVGQSYELVEIDGRSFTQIGIFMPFWGKFFLQSSLGDCI